MGEAVSDRPYLSIGDVLELLLEEFPDVTISKIRFLESQGLIDPERTSAGYRKFYDHDVERLRVILREQRENFLPLRVIKSRLETGQIDDTGGMTPPRGIGPLGASQDSGFDETGELEVPPGTEVPTGHHPAAQGRPPVSAAPPSAPPPPAAPRSPAPSTQPQSDSGSANPAAQFFAGGGAVPPSSHERTKDAYSSNEVSIHAGISLRQVGELESFGLLSPSGTGTAAVYRHVDVVVARACRGLLDQGLEPRHLRAWRQAVDREVSLFEQLVAPLLRQRNPQSRQQALQSLETLAGLGGELRRALLDAALRHHFED